MIILIPARRGSTRLPAKNIRRFPSDNNEMLTLVERTFVDAVHVWAMLGGDAKIVVSSDISVADLFPNLLTPAAISEGYSKVTDAPLVFKVRTGFTTEPVTLYYVDRSKKPYLVNGQVRMEDVIHDVLEAVPEDDCFLLLQPTSPFRSVENIVDCCSRFSQGEPPAIISIDPAYRPNGNFYLVRKTDFLQQNTVYVEGAWFFQCDWKESIDIDYIYNLRVAEAIQNDCIISLQEDEDPANQ